MKKIIALLAVAILVIGPLNAQKDKKIMKMERIEAKALYDAFKEGREAPYLKVMEIAGVATFVGPDPYALPSVEIAETADASSRVLCVLPFSDYLKLRKVSKKDRVVMRGNVLGFADRYDYVVVKQCEIVEVKKSKE